MQDTAKASKVEKAFHRTCVDSEAKRSAHRLLGSTRV